MRADADIDLVARLTRTGHAYTCRIILLDVVPDIKKVGVLAAVTGCLARENIRVDVLSGFASENLLVRGDQGEKAVGALRRLAAKAHKQMDEGMGT